MFSQTSSQLIYATAPVLDMKLHDLPRTMQLLLIKGISFQCEDFQLSPLLFSLHYRLSNQLKEICNEYCVMNHQPANVQGLQRKIKSERPW